NHRQVLITLTTPVRRYVTTLPARTQVIPHIVGQHAVLDQHVARALMTFVVEGEVSPLARHRAVVHERDQRTGDPLAHFAGVHRGLFHDGVGLETVTTGLVEQDAA